MPTQTSGRFPPAGAAPGDMFFLTDTALWYTWDGTQWLPEFQMARGGASLVYGADGTATFTLPTKPSGSNLLSFTGSVSAPDATTIVNVMRMAPTNASAAVSSLTNSAIRLLNPEVTFTGANNIGTVAAVYGVSNNQSTATITHQIGTLGLATLGPAASSGTSAVMAGLWGDVQFNAAGTATTAAAVYADVPVFAAAATITTLADFYGAAMTIATATVTNAYGGFLTIPTGAATDNVGLMVNTQGGSLPGLGWSAGAVIAGGAIIKSNPTAPPADTTSTTAVLSLAAGNSGSPLCALYYYRSTGVQAYVGFDGDSTTVVGGHTKATTDYIINVGGVSGRVLIDTSGNLYLAGHLGTTGIANGSVATAMSSLGPAGSHTTIQEWISVITAGGTRYIPCF